MFKDKIQAVKENIQEKKTLYITGAVCVIAGVIAGVAFKSKNIHIVNNVAPIFNNDNSSNVTLGGYMHKIIQCDQTDQLWRTVKDAANEAGVIPSVMSKHLNGHTDHIYGNTYSIVGLGTMN